MSFDASQMCATTVDTKILGLNVTEQCNLQCVYCYQRERRNNRANLMQFDVATAAIAEHLSANDGFRKVLIELIGGEVFLYFGFVRDVVEWTLSRSARWNKEFVFFIDTNGTLFTDAIKDWLYEHRDHVSVGLSLDGTPEAHDLNRSGSYARVAPHMSFVAKTWPDQIAKMTISPQTIGMVYDGVLHLVEHGFPVAANVPMEDVWGTPEEKARHVAEFRRQIEKLVEYFGSRTDIPLPNLINLPIGIIGSEEHDRRWCGSGQNMVSIETNGNVLPCNRYASMSFDQRLFDLPVAEDRSKCQYCLFKPACQTCEALNWEVNGNPQSRTSFHCEFTKWQIWGTAQVLAMRIKAGLDRYSEMSVQQRSEHVGAAVTIRWLLKAADLVLSEFAKHENLPDVAMYPESPLPRPM